MATQTDAVKERVDLVALISESLPLKRAGSNFKARCPFHEEDTPSFIVSPSRQTFHCFGCSAHGDCFTWLMEREGMSFPEALRVLAQRAGVPLTFERPERREERERLRATLDLATTFYERILRETAEGKAARTYLEGREISPASIRAWRLGFCPEQTTNITAKARERGVDASDLVRAGVLYERTGSDRTFEFFHGRLLFPLMDHHGSVVGLAGRVFADGSPSAKATGDKPADLRPKYINTPETPLYKKGSVLYGLDRAKDAIRKENLAVLVEGYTDVIASHQAGVTHVVATAGTALTDDHLRLLRRFTDRLAFAFDADAAGVAATRRAIDLALAGGFLVSVVPLPGGADPADLASRDAAAWRRAVAERGDVLAFLLRRSVAAADVRTPEGKRAVAEDLLPLVARVRDAVVQGDYVQQFARALGIDPRFVYDDLRRLGRQQRTGNNEQRTSREFPVLGSQFPVGPVDPQVQREERLLVLLLAEPPLIPKVSEHVPADTLSAGHTRALYAALQSWYARGQAPNDETAMTSLESFRTELPADLQPRFEALQLVVEVEGEQETWTPAAEAEFLIRELLRARLRRELGARTEALRVADAAGRRAALEAVSAATSELARVDHFTLS